MEPALLIDGLHGRVLALQVAHEDMPAPEADFPNAVLGLLVQHVLTPSRDFAGTARGQEGGKLRLGETRSPTQVGLGLWPRLLTLCSAGVGWNLLPHPPQDPAGMRGVDRVEGGLVQSSEPTSQTLGELGNPAEL